ncbi:MULTISPECIES: hypothetical protein [unclassified Ensifer]|uniref:hypothetical protein n=1 Tax=unclassified Ensifer TaxID=2633371 RepID=UPI00081345CF|nr:MULTISPECIES: hypothetical protein [unclassified Ensifer]OCP08692.1 hypothetical protein BBX50_19305 [Ensifer sp. LC11]
MVFIVDLALKNRRWDEDFDPKPPGRIRRILNALANRLADRRRAQIGSEKKCTAEPCGHAVQF